MKLKGELYPVSFIFLILVSVLLLWGCSPKGEELPFETIENDYLTFGEESLRVIKPRLVAITDSDNAQVLENLITSDAIEELEELDYHEFFAIAVLQRSLGSTGYTIDIKKVVKKGRTINVYADFNSLNPQVPVGPVHTLPRQIIKVPKDDLQGIFSFRLVVKGRIIARHDGVNLD